MSNSHHLAERVSRRLVSGRLPRARAARRQLRDVAALGWFRGLRARGPGLPLPRPLALALVPPGLRGGRGSRRGAPGTWREAKRDRKTSRKPRGMRGGGGAGVSPGSRGQLDTSAATCRKWPLAVLRLLPLLPGVAVAVSGAVLRAIATIAVIATVAILAIIARIATAAIIATMAMIAIIAIITAVAIAATFSLETPECD